MTTTFYCRNSAGTVGISPAPSASWTDTSHLSRASTSTVSSGDALTTDAYADSDSNNQLIVWRQYVSAPLLEGQIITGLQTLKAQCRVSETNSNNNMFFAVGIRIMNGATVQKVVLAPNTGSSTEASSTQLQNRQWHATSLSGNYTTVAGDRIVIEIGMSGDPSGTNTHNSSMRLGDSAGALLPENSTSTTDSNPWVQLADTLNFAVDLLKSVSDDLNAVGWADAAVVIIPLPVADNLNYWGDSGSAVYGAYWADAVSYEILTPAISIIKTRSDSFDGGGGSTLADATPVVGLGVVVADDANYLNDGIRGYAVTVHFADDTNKLLDDFSFPFSANFSDDVNNWDDAEALNLSGILERSIIDPDLIPWTDDVPQTSLSTRIDQSITGEDLNSWDDATPDYFLDDAARGFPFEDDLNNWGDGGRIATGAFWDDAVTYRIEEVTTADFSDDANQWTDSGQVAFGPYWQDSVTYDLAIFGQVDLYKAVSDDLNQWGDSGRAVYGAAWLDDEHSTTGAGSAFGHHWLDSIGIYFTGPGIIAQFDDLNNWGDGGGALYNGVTYPLTDHITSGNIDQAVSDDLNFWADAERALRRGGWMDAFHYTNEPLSKSADDTEASLNFWDDFVAYEMLIVDDAVGDDANSYSDDCAIGISATFGDNLNFWADFLNQFVAGDTINFWDDFVAYRLSDTANNDQQVGDSIGDSTDDAISFTSTALLADALTLSDIVYFVPAFPPFADSLDNWDDSIVVAIGLSAQQSDDLNTWDENLSLAATAHIEDQNEAFIDQATIAVTERCSDDLNNWGDSQGYTSNLVQKSAADSMSNWDDAVSYRLIRSQSVGDDVDYWNDAILVRMTFHISDIAGILRDKVTLPSDAIVINTGEVRLRFSNPVNPS